LTIKCNQKICLNNEKGVCSVLIPTVLSRLKPNNPECFLWESEKLKEKLFEQIKAKRSRFMSDEELEEKKKERKKAKREARKKRKK